MSEEASEIQRQVGRRIAELRIERGWTQADLANAVGLSDKYIQRIETGSVNLTIRSLTKYAGVLEVAVADLFVVPQVGEPRRGRPRKRRD